MDQDTPRLVLLARLAEAALWDDTVRRHESDPWAYLLRKLEATAGPLREYKLQLFNSAKSRLLADLDRPTLAPNKLALYKEVFEHLIPVNDYVDLVFHLEFGAGRESRHDGIAAVLDATRVSTVFEHQTQSTQSRPRAWDKSATETAGHLRIDLLERVCARGSFDAAKRARVARRLRRNLSLYLAPIIKEAAANEMTSSMLTRVETAVGASLRLLNRPR